MAACLFAVTTAPGATDTLEGCEDTESGDKYIENTLFASAALT